MANAPPSGRDGEPHRLICISEKQKYFCMRDWTGQITLIRLDKSDFSRNAPRARAGRAERHVRANYREAVARRERSPLRRLSCFEANSAFGGEAKILWFTSLPALA
jgi:hypothetical protein